MTIDEINRRLDGPRPTTLGELTELLSATRSQVGSGDPRVHAARLRIAFEIERLERL
ncbi:hypothetical protein [Geodermatophilus sp. SYSU D00815]